MTLIEVRDVALVALAVLAIVQLLALLVISIALYRKVGPLLDNVQRLLHQIEGTSTFISDALVRPIIRSAGTMSGVVRGASVILRFMQRRGGQ